MLRTGRQYLSALRDDRRIYIGGELVRDVTTHPAFRTAAHTIASLYDRQNEEGMRNTLSFEEAGERFAMHYLLPRSREDLQRRSRAHKAIADATYGLFGRSPDHVSSFIAGLATQPEVFDKAGPPGHDWRANLLSYYREARARDLYISYAVLPPQGGRDPDFSGRDQFRSPALQVTRETDAGVYVTGVKTLATAAVLSDEIWIGNVQPIAPGLESQALTCAVPVASRGVSLWSRQPFGYDEGSLADRPLSGRFDETDAVVLFKDVLVPWERVFVHRETNLSREIYIRTPSHCFGNHQSNVRFWSKLRLMVGLLSRITSANKADKIPYVRETLGRLAAYEAAIGGMVHGQCLDYENLGNGYVNFNRRIMYGALTWCTENHPMIADLARDLMGGNPLMMPANSSVLENADIRGDFETFWSTPEMSAVERMRLYKLAWDLFGSEFASRHAQYEKFYAGPPYVVRNHSFRECPWDELHAIVDGLLTPSAPVGSA